MWVNSQDLWYIAAITAGQCKQIHRTRLLRAVNNTGIYGQSNTMSDKNRVEFPDDLNVPNFRTQHVLKFRVEHVQLHTSKLKKT